MARHGHGKWTSWFAGFYYIAGSVYYFHKWIIVLGLGSALLVFVKQLPDLVRYSVPAVSLCLVYAGISFWRKQISYQFRSPNPCLRFEFLNVSYEEIDERTCVYTKKACVTAIYPTDHYVSKFAWSGDGNAEPELISGGTAIEIIDRQLDTGKACKIHFERMLNKRESLVFEYKLRLTKAQQPLKPFLAHLADMPNKSVNLCVKSFRLNSRWRQQLFASDNSELPIWENVKDRTLTDQLLTWELKPRNGHYYRISWDVTRANS